MSQFDIRDFQNLIHKMYFEKDVARGVSGTYMWLAEEMGELAADLRKVEQVQTAEEKGEPVDAAEKAALRENLGAEFADVMAWLATIANVVDIDLATELTKKYGKGCPGCAQLVCLCPDAEKP